MSRNPSSNPWSSQLGWALLLGFLLLGLPGLASADNRDCDVDGDGHDSPACGGADCDDDNADRFPGNPEICDAAGQDEDCDPATFGWRDEDRDGFPDARCCNTDEDGGLNCGTDCHDGNVALAPNSQVCNGSNVAICLDGGFQRDACLSGTVCIPQPNGTGVCGAAPPGYQAPPPFLEPQRRPLPGLDAITAPPPAVQQINPRLRAPAMRVPIRPKDTDSGGGG